MLNGIDFSHHQPRSMDAEISKADFFIHKLSESTTFVDPEAMRRIRLFANNKPTIVYHFLRHPKSAEAEALHFIKRVKDTGFAHTIGVALDYECDLVDTEAAEVFMSIVEKELHKRPILYCGDLENRRVYQLIRSHDWGLWIARYRKNPPANISDFWQYTSEPYDKDIFFGDQERLLSFIKEWYHGY